MPGIQTFDFSVNLLNAILWQNNVAVNLQSLLTAKQNWYNENQTAFWENWITDVFDLRTANDFGLIVWAIILGIPLTYIAGANDDNTTPFGFGPDTNSDPPNTNQNFFNSNFSASQTAQFTLTQAQKRLILQLRYRQLIARGTVPETNKILADLLVPTYGPMYMLDNLNMTESIVCVNGLPAFLSFLFSEFDLIPRPAAVKLIVIDGTFPAFGFGPDAGSPPNTNLNFYNSDFSPI
jgi:hypothetical protein